MEDNISNLQNRSVDIYTDKNSIQDQAHSSKCGAYFFIIDQTDDSDDDHQVTNLASITDRVTASLLCTNSTQISLMKTQDKGMSSAR